MSFIKANNREPLPWGGRGCALSVSRRGGKAPGVVGEGALSRARSHVAARSSGRCREKRLCLHPHVSFPFILTRSPFSTAHSNCLVTGKMCLKTAAVGPRTSRKAPGLRPFIPVAEGPFPGRGFPVLQPHPLSVHGPTL